MLGTRHNLNIAYTKEALQYLFLELKKELIRRPEKEEFVRRFLQEVFNFQRKPYSWDYISYAQDHISKKIYVP
jgi:hypothetical protein